MELQLGPLESGLCPARPEAASGGSTELMALACASRASQAHRCHSRKEQPRPLSLPLAFQIVPATLSRPSPRSRKAVWTWSRITERTRKRHLCVYFFRNERRYMTSKHDIHFSSPSHALCPCPGDVLLGTSQGFISKS